MSLERKLRSLILNLIFNPTLIRMQRWLSEKRRQLSGRPHVVSVFLQLDDPYSYILSHYLPSLAANYDIELRLYLSQAKGDDYQPAPDMLAEYAVADCARLASELGIPFLDKGKLPPTEHRVGLSDAVASLFGTEGFDEELQQALAVFWRCSECGGKIERRHCRFTETPGKPRPLQCRDAALRRRVVLGCGSFALLA